MEDDIREYIIDPSDLNIKENLLCQICWQYFYIPVICCQMSDPECVFCKGCLESILFQRDMLDKYTMENCPKCSRYLDLPTNEERDRRKWLDSLPVNRTIKRFIETLSAQCPFCKRNLNFSDLNKHLKQFCEQCPHTCEFCNNDVPGLKVKVIFDRHLDEQCMITCGRCNNLIHSKDSQKHLIECGQRLINCGPCQMSFPSLDLEKHCRLIQHFEKTMLTSVESHVMKEDSNIKTKESIVYQQRINFKKLLGCRVSLPFWGGELTIGITNQNEIYFSFNKKESQIVPFILTVKLVDSSGTIVRAPKIVMKNKDCSILQDNVTNYVDINHLIVEISMMM